jgi:hypothetical protein
VAFADEEEGDEKSADSAVAIQEPMQGFELVVKERAADQRGQFARFVDEAFPVAEASLHLVCWWRNEHGGRWRVVRGADPVRAGSDVTGIPFAAPDVVEQDSVSSSMRRREMGRCSMRSSPRSIAAM